MTKTEYLMQKSTGFAKTKKYEEPQKYSNNIKKNPFLTMTDADLKTIYPDYVNWLDTGIITDGMLGSLRDEYCKMYSSGGGVQIMEVQYLRECARRFSN